MEVNQLYHFDEDRISGAEISPLLELSMLASEVSPYDEMEKAIFAAYGSKTEKSLPALSFEYPLSGIPPMMTHVYGNDDDYTVAAKGAPERIMRICRMQETDKKKITDIVKQMAATGSRVIAVAGCKHKGVLPESQDEFNWKFAGLISLYDPPRKNLEIVFSQFAQAGIEAKLLTGDFPQTAHYIAEKAGLPDKRDIMSGEQVMTMSMKELREKVNETVIFARMFPDAKLKVIEALKENGEIVAMTGDGVNDGPALKASNIGIAMGHRGTQIARQAADIILTDDDLHKVIYAIRHGRRIFANLKKAIRYIISIHIPIILTASLPLLFGWKYPNIFTPIHVIFLELIMGPTCSIFFENEPEQPNTMLQSPRKRDIGIFEKGELIISIIQGLGITLAILMLYRSFSENHSIDEVRAVVFTSLLMSNILLTFTNRSFTDSLIKTIQYKNNLVPVVLAASMLILISIHAIPSIRSIFGMASISWQDILICLGVSFAGVIWFEIYKFFRRKARG
jgi:Ca2+-transporting ATPase